MNNRIALGVAAAVLLAVGGAAAYTMMGTSRPAPNVLIILWDTVRADRLSFHGYGKATSPHMAEWAEDAVVFERAVSPAMWTVPSHASMFTGLPPTTHGARDEYRWLDNHHVTMAEWFKDHGYATYAFSANPNLSPSRVNLVQGFDLVEVTWGGKWRKPVTTNTKRKLIRKDRSTEISPAYRGGATSSLSYNAGDVTRDALVDWLETRESIEKPWFVYLNYMEAHKPRVPALDSRRVISDDAVIETALKTDITMKSQLIYSYKKKTFTEPELAAINATYDASLIDLDNTTHTLLESLRAGGHLDNTIVVFTSDHGEQLGEHHLFGHRHAVYQQLLHVPLAISYPGVLEPGRVSNPVSNLNLYATLCDLAGLPRPDKPMATQNLMEFGKTVQAVFAESLSFDKLGFDKINRWFPNEENKSYWERTFRSVMLGDYKLIVDSEGEHELYHVGQDPHEEQEISGQNPEKLAELKAVLDKWGADVAPYDKSKRTEADGPARESEQMRQQLAVLGYLDEEEGDGGAGNDTDAAMEGLE